MGSNPVVPDLDGLWRELGLKMFDGEVAFDGGAPLAAIRAAIIKPR